MEDTIAITISIDGVQSENTHEIPVSELGFKSRVEWDASDDEAKIRAMVEYWNGNGLPCYSWEWTDD